MWGLTETSNKIKYKLFIFRGIFYTILEIH